MRNWRPSICLALVGCLFGFLQTDTAQAEVPGQLPARPDFKQHVQPLLENYCYECHADGAEEGGLEFDTEQTAAALLTDHQQWGRVWENVLTETMPPGGATQPTEAERQLLSRWIAQSAFELDPDSPDPGRVTIRRLNRNEYRYAVLDLLGVEFKVADHFSADDTGYGFDTIGDVLTLPPTLMNKYFNAAAEISEKLLRQAGAPEAKRSKPYRHVFGKADLPDDTQEQWKLARSVVERIASRAYRRPVSSTTVDNLLGLTKLAFEAGEASYQTVVCRAIEAILVSPRFLYRAEFQPQPDDPQSTHPLDEYALASRLSFFLWSSLPDEKLFKLAKTGQLRNQLATQVQRMLKDKKSRRMVNHFVGQWLQTEDVLGIHRGKKYQESIQRIRRDIQDETHVLFMHVMHSNRDVIDLIAADYSFLNSRLADFYGMPGVEGNKMRRVQFEKDSPRGGVLTHASVLIVTSNPNRTSPVKRGQFILDNILGMPVPPPPPDVPALEASKNSRHLTLRKQLELHRADPACASCHDRMDPLGLSLENFDAIGRWRDKDHGQPIDASSQLASGESFSGIRELREILKQKRRLFYRCLTKKLMTYALGRGIEYTDIPAVETIVDSMMKDEGRFSVMLMGIIESPQFQQRRGNNSTNIDLHE